MKAVVLASGGLDSSILLTLLKRERVAMLPIHVDYGQLAERREWLSLKRFCATAGLPAPVRVDVSGLGAVPSGLTRSGRNWRPDPFFPGRNLMLATVAAAVGYPQGYRTVALGLVANALYPDQTKEFVRAAEGALSESFGSKINVIAPLLGLPKAKVAELGVKARAPVHLTYSCQRGSLPPCGECSSCTDRAAALATLKNPRARKHPKPRARAKGDS